MYIKIPLLTAVMPARKAIVTPLQSLDEIAAPLAKALDNIGFSRARPYEFARRNSPIDFTVRLDPSAVNLSSGKTQVYLNFGYRIPEGMDAHTTTFPENAELACIARECGIVEYGLIGHARNTQLTLPECHGRYVAFPQDTSRAELKNGLCSFIRHVSVYVACRTHPKKQET